MGKLIDGSEFCEQQTRIWWLLGGANRSGLLYNKNCPFFDVKMCHMFKSCTVKNPIPRNEKVLFWHKKKPKRKGAKVHWQPFFLKGLVRYWYWCQKSDVFFLNPTSLEGDPCFQSLGLPAQVWVKTIQWWRRLRPPVWRCRSWFREPRRFADHLGAVGIRKCADWECHF